MRACSHFPELLLLLKPLKRMHTGITTTVNRDELLAQPNYQAMQEQLRTASILPPQEEAMLIELGLSEPAQ